MGNTRSIVLIALAVLAASVALFLIRHVIFLMFFPRYIKVIAVFDYLLKNRVGQDVVGPLERISVEPDVAPDAAQSQATPGAGQSQADEHSRLIQALFDAIEQSRGNPQKLALLWDFLQRIIIFILLVPLLTGCYVVSMFYFVNGTVGENDDTQNAEDNTNHHE